MGVTEYLVQTMHITDADGFAKLNPPDEREHGKGWHLQGSVQFTPRPSRFDNQARSHLAIITWIRCVETEVDSLEGPPPW